MAHDSKKRHYPAVSETSTATTSSSAVNARPGAAAASASTRYPPPQRTDSPPASAYFSSFGHTHSTSDTSHYGPRMNGYGNPYAGSGYENGHGHGHVNGHGMGYGGGNDEPQALTPDVNAHFAYSTQLRRHNVDTQMIAPPTDIASFAAQGAGLLERAVRAVVESTSGARQDDGDEGGRRERRMGETETPSEVFVHYSVEDALAHFRTSPTTGLASSAIPHLRVEHGYNEFSVQTPEPLLIKFAKTIYESSLTLLLFASALVSAVMGNVDDAVSITVAILIVLTVGFVQERRSEKSLEALNKLVPHHCHIIRDGQPLHLLANELVPGDVVKFSVGDRIPADLRLIEAVELEIDESSLTGETRPARKTTDRCELAPGRQPGDTLALADRICVAHMGTLVRGGHGSGMVIGTGVKTEFGAIFEMMQDVEEKKTPLQLSMDELAKRLSILSFGVIGIICFIGVLQQRSWLEMFTIGVSLAVAAIPEGLPIVTTVTLALGVLRMAKRKAIVKKLPSVEALGSVSVICSDKTGTLTMNEQTVTELYTVNETTTVERARSHQPFGPAVRRTLEVGALCNYAFRNETGLYVGQATDVALLNVLPHFDMHDPRPNFHRLAQIPFNSEHKFMAVSGTHAGFSDREFFYMKGSIEAVLQRCGSYYVSPDSTPALDDNTRTCILQKAESTAARGLRVLAMAYGHGSADEKSTTANTAANANLVFVGFEAMLDPPREGVARAIAALHAGGVQVVMITGDAEHTALSIARQLGMRVQPGTTSVLTGAALDQMSRAQLRDAVGSVSVFARTTPRHKLAIIEAFQDRGAVVAMTGDGVNDAPALKKADIGVSMGKSGTDVAKEAADVILVDDNFTTILPAVEEGKSIFHNIQNFLAFQLSTAVAALSLITLSTFFGLSNPLNAMQILFINILMDGPPSQSLGVDPIDPAVMRKPPRKKDEPIISRRLLGRVLFSASIIVFGTLFIYSYALSDARVSRREQTMTFTCFVFLDLVSALQNRGLGCGFTQNRMLLTTVSVSFLTQLMLVYVPFMQAVFQTEALTSNDLSTLLMMGGLSFGLHEIRRRYERTLSADDTYVSVAEELT